MKAETIEIVDRGRGPQLSTSRITVMDVFYWFHRGNSWDQILEMIPALSHDEIDAIAAYVAKHHDELVEWDRLADERTARRIAEQHARGGIFALPDETLSRDERVAMMREKLRARIAEKNGEPNPG
jgi:uncharacterized protein (DUF433 family)